MLITYDVKCNCGGKRDYQIEQNEEELRTIKSWCYGCKKEYNYTEEAIKDTDLFPIIKIK